MLITGFPLRERRKPTDPATADKTIFYGFIDLCIFCGKKAVTCALLRTSKPLPMPRLIAFLLSSLLLFGAASAQFGGSIGGGGFQKKALQAFPEFTSVTPGQSFQVALELKHGEGYHSYFTNPGTVGYPLGVDWQLPEGITASGILFPTPHKTVVGEGADAYNTYGYEGTTIFLVTFAIAQDTPIGDLTIAGEAGWQECDDTGCLPKSQDVSFKITIGDSNTLNSAKSAAFKSANATLPQSSADWEITATETDNVITLTATFPADTRIIGGKHFYASDFQVDAQAAQDFTVEGNTLTGTLPRNLGNEKLFLEAAEVLNTLTGVLEVELADGSTRGYRISTERKGEVAEIESSKGHEASFIRATDEQKAAGLALWNPDAEIDYVLLGGAAEEKLTFIVSLGLVLIGGLLLNLMPCVFPVLGIKIMGFVAQAGEDERKIKIHGLVFGLGLLVAMWVLAAIIIALDLSWGQQLGNPIFLGSIIILLFLLGLNLFGLFEFGTRMTSVGGDLQSKKGYSGSFFSGVLTTLIATPCSGPFLGVVMGYALSLDSKLMQFVIFTVFALGISLPYVILGFFPKAIKKLPQPGPWMESFKQLMAFAMFATVAFFLKSYIAIVGLDNFSIFLFALVAIALAAYIYGRWGTPYKSAKQRRVIGYGIAGTFAAIGLATAFATAELDTDNKSTAQNVGKLAWTEWYPGIVEASRGNQRIMWLDFTADW